MTAALAALEQCLNGADRIGGDRDGMPECPWCRSGPDGDDHADDCDLVKARAALAILRDQLVAAERISTSLIERCLKHLTDLAPHARDRKTALLLGEATDALAARDSVIADLRAKLAQAMALIERMANDQ